MNTLPISEYAFLRTSTAKEIKKINHKDFFLRIITSKKNWTARALTFLSASTVIDKIIDRHIATVREQEIFIRGLASKISQIRIRARHGDLGGDWSMEGTDNLISHSKNSLKQLIAKVSAVTGKSNTPFNQSFEKLSSPLRSLFEALDDLHIEVLELEASLSPVEKLSILSNQDLTKFIESISSGQ